MLKGTMLTICSLVVTTGYALADIYVWEGTNPDNYTINDAQNTIQINVAGTYGIRAWNPDTYALQPLGDITIQSGMIGNVTIRIAYSDAGDPGATNIKRGDITPNTYGYYVYLDELRISADMATEESFTCDKIRGDIEIGGTVGPYDFIADEGTTGDLTIGTDDPNDPNDYVTVTGNITMGRHRDGNITIHGYLNGNLSTGRPADILIDGPGEHNGNISINNQLPYMGTLRIGDEACEDDPNDPNDAYDPNVPYATMNGDIYVHYGTQGAGGAAGGWMQIFGDMNGSIEIGNGVDDGGSGEEDCWGSIYIAQSLHNNITIHGDLGSGTYIYRPGMIIIGENLEPDPNDPNAIVPKIKVEKNVLGNTSDPDKDPAKIHILGDMAGLIEVGEDLLQGRIYVSGAFYGQRIGSERAHLERNRRTW